MVEPGRRVTSGGNQNRTPHFPRSSVGPTGTRHEVDPDNNGREVSGRMHEELLSGCAPQAPNIRISGVSVTQGAHWLPAQYLFHSPAKSCSWPGWLSTACFTSSMTIHIVSPVYPHGRRRSLSWRREPRAPTDPQFHQSKRQFAPQELQ